MDGDERGKRVKRTRVVEWIARVAVGVVFVVNVQCAFGFVVNPSGYAGAYELSGVSGAVAVQGLGVAFLMWNVTYPLVIWKPNAHRTLFGVVLVQQAVGLIGESAIASQLPAGHEVLAAGIGRFIAFDAFGLVIMGIAFALLMWTTHRSERN